MFKFSYRREVIKKEDLGKGHSFNYAKHIYSKKLEEWFNWFIINERRKIKRAKETRK